VFSNHSMTNAFSTKKTCYLLEIPLQFLSTQTVQLNAIAFHNQNDAILDVVALRISCRRIAFALLVQATLEEKHQER